MRSAPGRVLSVVFTRGVKRALGLVALAGWALICILALGGTLNAWSSLPSALASVPWGEALAARPTVTLARHGVLVIATLVFASSLAGAGGVIASLVRLPGAAGWERRAFAVLAGFAALGTLLYGLALTGLFFAGMVLFAAAAGLACPGAWKWAVATARVRVPWPPVGRFWALLAALPAVTALVFAFCPEVHVDAYAYHLAIPQQALRMHKLTAEGVALPHLFPLTAEMVYALGVIPDLDALRHFLQLVPFVAGVALLAGWANRAAGLGAGWLAAGAVASCGLVWQLVPAAKSDLVVAAYVAAAGASVARGLGGSRGWWLVGSALLGCGAAVKFNGLAFAAVAWLGILSLRVVRARCSVRTDFLPAVLTALPVAPWLLRSWLWMGDPLWPMMSGFLPGVLWDEASGQAIRAVRDGPLASGTGTAMEGARELLHQFPAVVAVLPVALAGGWALGMEGRWLLGYSTVSVLGLAFAMRYEWERLALPGCLVMAAVAAAAVARAAASWPVRARQAALAAALCAACLPLGGYLAGAQLAHRVPWLTGALTPEVFRTRVLTTYAEVAADLDGLPAVGSVMGMGEYSFYRLPGRFLSERCYGRTWAWVLTRECATVERIRVRMKQMGCRHLLENFALEQYPYSYKRAFYWDDRQLALWRRFVGRNLAVVVPPRHEDGPNGGYCIYALLDRPRGADPATLPYLPGLGALYCEVTRHAVAGDPAGWVKAAESLEHRLPGVDFVTDLAGTGYYCLHQYEEAYRHFLPGLLHRTIGARNFPLAAESALQTGRREEAYWLFERTAEIDPMSRNATEKALRALRQSGVVAGQPPGR